MMWSDYWNALGARQRSGLIVGAVLIVVVTAGLGVWLFRDPFVPFARGLDGDRLNGIVQALERAKVDYRVEGTGDTVSVPRSLLGKAHAAAGADTIDAPPSVGLELFKQTDFSETDFAQRINYQRALQGELTRTIETIAGVRSARVHVILPDAGLFKRDGAKATAAVSLTMQPGRQLTRTQVTGVQRLVAASVPEIKLDDVVVLDGSGTSLTRPSSGGEDELSSAQLDIKRQVDQYFEAKLGHMLAELAPDSILSLSVDTTLDSRQLRVTTEEPIGTRDQHDPNHVMGVVVRERQSRRGHLPAPTQTDYTEDSDGTEREYEYKVGNRVEQTLSVPGSIKRISVAVAIRGAPEGLSGDAIEELVSHAVGADRTRGDSVSVLLLPGGVAVAEKSIDPAAIPKAAHAPVRVAERDPADSILWWVAGIAVLLSFVALLILVGRRRSSPDSGATVDEEAVAAKVRQWLAEGAGSGRA